MSDEENISVRIKKFSKAIFSALLISLSLIFTSEFYENCKDALPNNSTENCEFENQEAMSSESTVSCFLFRLF